MLYKSTVNLSDIPCRYYLSKANAQGSQYVYAHVGDKYNKEKKYSVPVRLAIGKVCADDSGKMYPNNNFYEKLPDVIVKEQHPSRSMSQDIGAFLLIQRVFNELGVVSLLQKHFLDKSALVLDLATFMMICEDKALCHFKDYARTHPLFREDQHIVSDETISRFLSDTSQDQIYNYIVDWNAQNKNGAEIFILYDASNKNCQAGDIDFVEFGHAQANADSPIGNYGIGLDAHKMLPLFYDGYQGSIPDVSQLEQLVNKATEFGYQKITFILDRGFFFDGNIRYIDESKCNFILMVKGNKQLVGEIIDKLRGSFEMDHKYLIKTTSGVYGCTEKREFAGKDRYFHVYCSTQKLHTESDKLSKQIEDLEVHLRRCKGKILDSTKDFDPYFDLQKDKSGKLIFFERKYDAITAELKRAGYFTIITSEKMTAQEAYLLYKKRDSFEKIFCDDKAFLSSDSSVVHSTQALRTKMFIEFIALIARSRLYSLIQDASIRVKGCMVVHNVPDTLIVLDRVKAISLKPDGRYTLQNGLSRTTMQIFSYFGVSEIELNNMVSKLLSRLSAASIEYENDLPINATDKLEDGSDKSSHDR